MCIFRKSAITRVSLKDGVVCAVFSEEMLHFPFQLRAMGHKYQTKGQSSFHGQEGNMSKHHLQQSWHVK